MKQKDLEFFSGYPPQLPYGANVDGEGVHFSIFSRNATRVWLMFFQSPDDDTPSDEIELLPGLNRTGDIWHTWVKGIKEGQLYLWRMDGPDQPTKGHLFNPNNYLIDPYAKAITGNEDKQDWFPPSTHPGNGNAAKVPKCVVCSDHFEWDLDRPLNRPLSETVIYECHVRGLTIHPSSGCQFPGTYKGIVEKIPYFKDLGITSLELLPVQEFGYCQQPTKNPFTGEKLNNYWGYNTVGFFAPHGGYSSSGNRGEQVREFKWMVRELHKAGIEVILDVVFNHTAEGGLNGPRFSFKGIENSIYYILNPRDGSYMDYTGCGNTFNCNHPIVSDFILSCLHYWVLHMHVDGFRFDLASVLGRDEKGNLLPNPPLLKRIEELPILRGTKIIAEAWDAAGAYQVGDFSGRWAEWNGKFRDDVRKFWKGTPGSVGPLATRFSGSPDLYGDDGRTPHHSINFITSHDGFTLNDWASYEKKHNLENGEQNKDGDNTNNSKNHGIEGPSSNPAIEVLRLRQTKNMMATLILSLGVPMLLAGDEIRRTQKGNNNAYCQDNEVSWHNWDFTRQNEGMLRFTSELIHFLERHPVLRRQSFYSGEPEEGNYFPDIAWYGAKCTTPDWNGTNLCLGLLILGKGNHSQPGKETTPDIYIMFNANNEERIFYIPAPPGGGTWKVSIDTYSESPKDIYLPGTEPELGKELKYPINPHSMVVLTADYEH